MKTDRQFSIRDVINSKRTTVVLIVILVVLVNIFGMSLSLNVDLTTGKSYTLLDISRKVVSSLEDPVFIKAFFTSDLPAEYNDVEQYFEDLLNEYSRVSRGKFKYEFLNVEKEENKNLAHSYGILPLEIFEIRNDRREQRTAYMGAAVIYGNMIERLDINTTLGLEHQITTKIKKMINKMNLLSGLGEKSKITFYRSSGLSIYNIQGFSELDASIKEIFDELNEENSGYLEFVTDDPSPEFAEELTDRYGINSYPVNGDVDENGQLIDPERGVLSLIIEVGDRSASVDLPLAQTIFGTVTISGIENLKDRLNSEIEGLASVNPPVAYLNGHYEGDISDQQGESGAAYFNYVVSQDYDIKMAVLNDLMMSAEELQAPADPSAYEIPEGARTLVINGPKTELSEEELFKIDQFLMKGGSLFLLLDSFYMDQSNQNMGVFFRPLKTGLEDWLSKKGITVNRDMVNDINSPEDQTANANNQRPPKYYYIPYIDQESMNQKTSITKNLNRFLTGFASSITVDSEKAAEQGFEVTELFKTSEESWVQKDNIDLANNFPPPAGMMQQYTLAVLAEGNFKSSFESIPEYLKNNELWKEKTVISESINPGKIIVIGTSQIANNMFLMQAQQLRISDQFMIIQNIMDHLNGNADIAELRTKGRGITKLRESSDSTRSVLRIFNIVLLPLFIIAAGIIVWIRRRSRRKKIKYNYSAPVKSAEKYEKPKTEKKGGADE